MQVRSRGALTYVLGRDTYTCDTDGVLATIIDFSLSRAEVGGQVIYNNLAEDPSIFQVVCFFVCLFVT